MNLKKQRTYKNLVFEGGGIKGIAYGGALQELDNLSITQDIIRVAGTSVGAITATLVSIGYNPKEITDIISSTKFSEFADNSWGYVRDLFRLWKSYGWHKGEKFEKWISDIIEKKTGNKDITFQDIRNQRIEKNYKLLYLVGTNVTKQKMEIFSHETTPAMKLRDAVRISMGIPLYFQSIKGKNKDVYVDGGVIWNYPIQIFDNLRYRGNSISDTAVFSDIPRMKDDPDYRFNSETLGFRLDSTEEMNFNKDNWSNVPVEVKNLKGFAGVLIGLLLNVANKIHLTEKDWNRTIFIDTLDVDATDFKLSQDKMNQLIENGKKGVINYFSWLDKN